MGNRERERARQQCASPTFEILKRKFGVDALDLQNGVVKLCAGRGGMQVSNGVELVCNEKVQVQGRTLANFDKAPVGNNTQKGWIYQLLFPNGLKYVGQTESWKGRMRSHKRGKKRDDGQLIKRAIKKAGWANIKVSVLQEFPIGGLSKKERRAVLSLAEVEWIARLGTLKPGGYNTTPGGDAQPMDDPEVAAWQKQQIKKAMNRPDVRAKKRGLWQDPEHRAMMRAARTGSVAWMQARKDCQNTDECNEKRRATWARKRAIEVAAMGVAEGREFMRCAKKRAVRKARQAAKRIADHSDRDPVAETEAFYDKEIAGYEAGIWRARTQASSSNARIDKNGQVLKTP